MSAADAGAPGTLAVAEEALFLPRPADLSDDQWDTFVSEISEWGTVLRRTTGRKWALVGREDAPTFDSAAAGMAWLSTNGCHLRREPGGRWRFAGVLDSPSFGSVQDALDWRYA